MPNLEALLPIAQAAAWGASDILVKIQTTPLDEQGTGDDLVTIADHAANDYILAYLKENVGTQEFGYLSEETFKADETGDRFQHPYVWIIDPLDGTRDYLNQTSEYAVHIALAYEGRPVLAIVACPAANRLYYAIQGNGTFVEVRNPDGSTTKTPVRVSDRRQIEDLTIVASRTHRDDRFDYLLKQLPLRDRHYVGSVGGKIASVVEQQTDIYISLSGKSAPKDWDIAAPELILTEAGGKFTHFDGSPLRYNRKDVRQWGGLLASNGYCHEELCQRSATIIAEYDAQVGQAPPKSEQL